jgi:hypothetical protein
MPAQDVAHSLVGHLIPQIPWDGRQSGYRPAPGEARLRGYPWGGVRVCVWVVDDWAWRKHPCYGTMGWRVVKIFKVLS